MAAPRNAGLLILVLLLALFFVFRKKDEPGPGDGPAVPSGSISGVNVSQQGQAIATVRQGAWRGARMGTHLAPKALNQELNINVTWTPTTRNSSGAFIPWNYQLEYVIRTTAGALVRSGVLVTYTSIGQGNLVTLNRVLAGVPNPGSYDFTVDLLAMSSDGNGQPVLPYIPLDAMTHPSAFRVG